MIYQLDLDGNMLIESINGKWIPSYPKPRIRYSF